MKKITAVLCSLILLVLCGCAPAENAENSSEKSAPQSSGSLSSESISENISENKAELPESSLYILSLLDCREHQESDPTFIISTDDSTVIYKDTGKKIPFPEEFKGSLGFGELFPAFYIGENYYYFIALDPQSGNPVLYYVSNNSHVKSTLDIHPNNISAFKTKLWLINEDDGFILQYEEDVNNLYYFTEKGTVLDKIYAFETGSATEFKEMKFINSKIGFITRSYPEPDGTNSSVLYRSDDGGKSWREVSLSLEGYNIDYKSRYTFLPTFVENFGIITLSVWDGDSSESFSWKKVFDWSEDSSLPDKSFYRTKSGKHVIFFSEDYGESWLPLFFKLITLTISYPY